MKLVSFNVRDNFQCQSRTLRLFRRCAMTCLQHSYRCVCVLLHLHKRKCFCCVIKNVKSGRLYQQRRCSDLHHTALQETCYAGVPFGAIYGITPSVCEHHLHPETNFKVMRSCDSVAYRGGWFGGSNPPSKFRKYRWSPRSHEQEEPASRFPLAVHCVLIRL